MNCEFELPHSIYSTDLASKDYHLLLNLRKRPGGNNFFFNSEVIAPINSYFQRLIQHNFLYWYWCIESYRFQKGITSTCAVQGFRFRYIAISKISFSSNILYHRGKFFSR